MIEVFKWHDWNYSNHGSWTKHLNRVRLYEENWIHIFYSRKDKCAIVLWHGDEIKELSHYYENNFLTKAADRETLKKEVDRFLSKLEQLKIFL